MANHEAWSLICRLFSGGVPVSSSALSPAEMTVAGTLDKAVKPTALNQTFTMCPYCQLHRCKIWNDRTRGRVCHCPECGQVEVAVDDLAGFELDENWLRAKLRLAMDIYSRDGIIDLGTGVWHLGDARHEPVLLTRSLMNIWREPTILDRVRVKGGDVRVIAPRHRETRGAPLGHGVTWLPLEERFAFYGGGITYIPIGDASNTPQMVDPATPIFGPFSTDFRWVTLPDWTLGVIRCTEGQAAVFKALWSFKGEQRTGEIIMARAGLESDKLGALFKVKTRDRDKPEAWGPKHAYDSLVSKNKREGLYWMPCASGS